MLPNTDIALGDGDGVTATAAITTIAGSSPALHLCTAPGSLAHSRQGNIRVLSSSDRRRHTPANVTTNSGPRPNLHTERTNHAHSPGHSAHNTQNRSTIAHSQTRNDTARRERLARMSTITWPPHAYLLRSFPLLFRFLLWHTERYGSRCTRQGCHTVLDALGDHLLPCTNLTHFGITPVNRRHNTIVRHIASLLRATYRRPIRKPRTRFYNAHFRLTFALWTHWRRGPARHLHGNPHHAIPRTQKMPPLATLRHHAVEKSREHAEFARKISLAFQVVPIILRGSR